MRTLWLTVALATTSAVGHSTVAHADRTQVGGFVGPRFFSSDTYLGYLEYEKYHPNLRNSVELGARVAKPFGFRWLNPELEFVVVPTKTTVEGGAAAASVIWLEPRFHLRIDVMPGRRIEPFFLIGGGAPISASSARKTFNSGISGEGYLGAGARIDTDKGFAFRLDARVSVQPGGKQALAVEGDITIGIELNLGVKRKHEEVVVAAGPPPDKDEDGIPDVDDKCPDRPEDFDNFEDGDGCTDIDNDGDRVLDIADKCPTEQENLNGYADDDGCIDSVPAEVDALRGTIEGLIYGEGETGVRDSAQKSVERIAKVMLAQPSIKIVLVGHTDDREAKAFIEPAAEGQPAPPDLETVSTDLARARAEAVRQALVGQGVPAGRVVVDGVGAEEPVADNGTPKGRLANRRVEIKLFVPR
jgi:outer membrane protein OmpA-like peptidoglycan-associated protein